MRASKKNTDYRAFLVDEFSKRRSKNQSYSVRAFARDLGIGPSTLAGVLARRRNLSKKNAIHVAQKLGFGPHQTNALLQAIGFRADSKVESNEFLGIDDDTFNMISNWYYFAIINLCKLGNNNTDPKFFVDRLGLTKVEIENALSRLQRLGFIEIANGEYIATTPTLSTTRNVPSTALRKYHKQNLEKAIEAIDSVPLDRRDISSITFPADLSKYKEVTDLIMEFKRKAARFFECGKPSEVYTLAIQLFPVSKPTGRVHG